MPNANLLNHISLQYSHFTKRERLVADFVLQNAKQVVDMNISDLAESCHVGDTTVFRFCRRIKAAGFQDFKMSLALSLSQMDIQETESLPFTAQPANSQQTAQQIFSIYQSVAAAALRQTDAALIDQAVRLIESARTVHLFGFGGSGIAAMMMQNKFRKLTNHIVYLQDAHVQLTSAALLTPDDAAFIFSNSGTTKDAIHLARLAHESGAKVIFATGFLKSPAKSYATLMLPCGQMEGPIEGGSIHALTAQLFTVDVLYAEYYRHLGDTAFQLKKRTATAVVEKML